MTHEAFERVLQEQLSLCTDILCKKSKEYSSQEDKLHNFKNAAGLQGVTQIQALSGMMAKHTISIYDMCMSDKAFPVELWEEKITDSINYLLLLKAAVVEEQDKPTTEKTSSVPTQAELEDLFDSEKYVCGLTDVAKGEPVKGKYEGLSNWELKGEIHNFINPENCYDCESRCPISIARNGSSLICANFAADHPEEFRKIAIEWLEAHDKKELPDA